LGRTRRRGRKGGFESALEGFIIRLQAADKRFGKGFHSGKGLRLVLAVSEDLAVEHTEQNAGGDHTDDADDDQAHASQGNASCPTPLVRLPWRGGELRGGVGVGSGGEAVQVVVDGRRGGFVGLIGVVQVRRSVGV
jgi:hypothetical protein